MCVRCSVKIPRKRKKEIYSYLISLKMNDRDLQSHASKELSDGSSL